MKLTTAIGRSQENFTRSSPSYFSLTPATHVADSLPSQVPMPLPFFLAPHSFYGTNDRVAPQTQSIAQPR
jgi:hypothetical protein